MRLIAWVLSTILVVLLIFTLVALKFIPKKEIITAGTKKQSISPEEAVPAQIPQEQEYDMLGAAFQDISATVGSDAIKTRPSEVGPVLLEARLQAPALSPEENMAEALKRVEAAKFFEKIKQARNGAGRVYQVRGAAFSSEDKLFNEKEK